MQHPPAESRRLLKHELFATLPPEWPHDPSPTILQLIANYPQKIVVLDDDPTGTQTVHGIPVLTEWSVEALQRELTSDHPAFYLLTNSRSLPPEAAAELNREIGRNLVAAAAQTRKRFAVVSRSDSTLRGHFPIETDALAESLGGEFDATLLIPAFFPGGRYTINDVHYVVEGDWLVPAAETEFARDTAFGYKSSNLREWVAEKSGGTISADAVQSISIDDIRRGGPDQVTQHLVEMPTGSVCIINATSDRDLAVATQGIIQAENQGRRYLYRTAASFVPLRAGIDPRPLLTRADLDLPAEGGGLIVVGSYVPKTSGQVAQLIEQPDMASLEISVERLLANGDRLDEISQIARRVDQALARGEDIVIYTSRRLITGDDPEKSLAIGQRVSDGLISILHALTVRPRYVLAKGGITSSDVATKGLGVRRAMVLGQILAGVPVWQLGPESRYPGLVYIVFPGNVGGPQALGDVVSALRKA